VNEIDLSAGQMLAKIAAMPARKIIDDANFRAARKEVIR
jgi:hypothetical protein